MAKGELHEILFKWLHTLDLKADFKKIEDISDGVAMAQALNQIEPEWFPDNWLFKIKTDTGNNWRLKLSNLKKILEQVLDYYQECFNQPLVDFRKPDVVKIGDQGDPLETGRLLQLILGCAVNCTNKQMYIERIMDMAEYEQRVLMECIQELDSERALSFSASLHLEPQVEQLLAQLAESNSVKDKILQKCSELELQISVLQDDKSTLIDDKKKLIDEMQSNIDSGAGYMRRQMDLLKEELFKIETSRDDYKAKVEQQDKEITDFKVKVEELQKSATEARHLKDEVDILRETAEKVEKYEATLHSYKKKLEETGDLKRELKLLETKNLSYIQQNMELEEELKKTGFWKSQFEVYKKQVGDLQEKFDEETKRADKLQYEVKSVQDKLTSLNREKERLIMERDSLKEANEELKCLQLQTSGSEVSALDENSGAEDLVISNAELRQRVVRLKHENNMLKMNQKTDETDSLSVLQTLLEDTKEQLEKVRRENREANQKIIVLEGEMKDILSSGGDSQAGANKVFEMQQLLQKERQKFSVLSEEKDAQIADNKQVIGLMQEKLSQKELELQEAEDRHKKYIEKAKNVIRGLDPTSLAPGQEDSILRNQLIESQKRLKELQGEQQSRDLREQIITTSYHNLAQVKYRDSVEQRLASFSSPQTFLSRQRQYSTRKTSYNTK